jgi:ribonucleoside-diphosphate reductase alpha chain
MSALDAVSMQARAQIDDAAASDIKFCAIDDPTCEACQ